MYVYKSSRVTFWFMGWTLSTGVNGANYPNMHTRPRTWRAVYELCKYHKVRNIWIIERAGYPFVDPCEQVTVSRIYDMDHKMLLSPVLITHCLTFNYDAEMSYVVWSTRCGASSSTSSAREPDRAARQQQVVQITTLPVCFLTLLNLPLFHRNAPSSWHRCCLISLNEFYISVIETREHAWR